MSNSKQPALNIGDIALAPFPFADHSITKLRPAILVSHLPNDAWLVIYITSALDNQTDYDVILNPSSENNLKVTSLAWANRLTVIAGDMIERPLGKLTESERKAISNKLSQLGDTFLN